MTAGDRHVPDWRDTAAYAPLLAADRPFFAWEWLRRNCGYRAAAERALKTAGNVAGAGEAAGRWGLHAFVPPGLTAPEARPIWRWEVHPFVLRAEAGPPQNGEPFDLERVAAMSTLVTAGDGRQHLLISDGLRAIRIDILEGSILRGPAELRYLLAGLAAAEQPVLTLRRLIALWRTGGFCRSLHPVEPRAKRWLLMLRASDALRAGTDQREIAAVLLSADAREPRWRTELPSVRSRVQRLVRSARAMEKGGFWALLSGDERWRSPGHLPSNGRFLFTP